MNRLFLSGILIFAYGLSYAEVLTNSIGEKIDIKPTGTWVKISSKNTAKGTIVKNGDSPVFKIRDGNDKEVPVTIYFKIDDEPKQSLSIKELTSKLELT